jgi:predicted lipoprotein with Yx(FWY)xxD motif
MTLGNYRGPAGVHVSILAAVAFAVAVVSGCASAPTTLPAPFGTNETSLGTVLTDSKGMTLYTLKSDPDGQSQCIKRCAKTWPPLMVSAGDAASGGFSIIPRPDGGKQWAYRNRPLYLWVKDKKPGDVTGHDKGDVWYVARP